MRNFIIFLFLSLFVSAISGAPIYGATVTADGSVNSGPITKTLGSHDDQFIQIDNGTSVIVNFSEGMAALADGTSAADLRIHTYDQPAPVNGEISFSSDGDTFTLIGVYSDANTNNIIDFNLDALNFDYVVAVRIKDISGTTAGFDWDALEGFNGGSIPDPVPEPSSIILVTSFMSVFFIKIRIGK